MEGHAKKNQLEGSKTFEDHLQIRSTGEIYVGGLQYVAMMDHAMKAVS